MTCMSEIFVRGPRQCSCLLFCPSVFGFGEFYSLGAAWNDRDRTRPDSHAPAEPMRLKWRQKYDFKKLKLEPQEKTKRISATDRPAGFDATCAQCCSCSCSVRCMPAAWSARKRGDGVATRWHSRGAAAQSAHRTPPPPPALLFNLFAAQLTDCCCSCSAQISVVVSYSSSYSQTLFGLNVEHLYLHHHHLPPQLSASHSNTISPRGEFGVTPSGYAHRPPSMPASACLTLSPKEAWSSPAYPSRLHLLARSSGKLGAPSGLT
jgi:hypothetical protein